MRGENWEITGKKGGGGRNEGSEMRREADGKEQGGWGGKRGTGEDMEKGRQENERRIKWKKLLIEEEKHRIK